MKKKIGMFVSSLTGNTKKIADYLEGVLAREEYEIDRMDTRTFRYTVSETELTGVFGTYDVCILMFWCRKSGLDDASRMLAGAMEGQKVIAVGTMGHTTEDDYSERVRDNVFRDISRNNHCLGIYLSQGRINPERTEARRRLPKDAPHYLDEAGYLRHLESRTHPDERDLQGAGEYVLSALRRHSILDRE